MELIEQEFKGGVKSRTHAAALVQEPVEVIIEGKATSLSLMDAKTLIAGLAKAVAQVEQAETTLKGQRDHLMVIGSTRSGMSIWPTSKLGAGGAIEQLLMSMPPELRTPETLRALTPGA